MASPEDALERRLGSRGDGQSLDARASDRRPKARRERENLLAVGDVVRRTPRPALLPPVLVAIERRLLTRVARLRAGETAKRSISADDSSPDDDRETTNVG